MKNIIDTIEQGIATPSVKDRLIELESYEKDLMTNIEYEKMKKPVLTKAQVIYWLESFKYGDIDDEKYKQKIIDALVRSVYVYDSEDEDGDKIDKIVVYFNSSSNNMVEVKGSFLGHSAPPNTLKTNTLIMTHYEVFAFIADVKRTR